MQPIPPFEKHLDADTLAALAEHSLFEDEKEAVFAHLAECENCRECLRVNAQLKEFDWNAGSAPNRGSRSPWVSRSVGVAAVCASSLVAALWLTLSSQFPGSDISPRTLHAMPEFTMQASRGIKGRWGAVSLQKLSTNDRLAARNFHRFSNEIILTTVSFRRDVRSPGEDESRTPGFNQIKLETALGERWVTFAPPRDGERGPASQ